MPASLADSLTVLLPHLEEALAGPDAVRDLETLAGDLPPIARGGFECRLGATASRVDLQQCVVRGSGEPARLADYVAAWDSTARVPAHPAWRRLHDLCTRWSVDGSSLQRGVVEMWLEFDVDARPQVTPVPSVFVAFDRAALEPLETRELALTVLALLQGAPVSAALRASLGACFEMHRDGAAVSHLGVMLSRATDAVRINVKRLAPDRIPDCLEQLGWPGPMRDVAELVAWLGAAGVTITVCLDVGARFHSRVGLECAFPAGPERAAKWPPFLDELVARGLCAPGKRDALLAWRGTSLPTSSALAWPPHLIAESLLHPADQLGAFEREISHVKLVCEPGAPLEAKAYLWFHHAWYPAGALDEATR